MLNELCSGFEDAVGKLNPKDAEFAFDLRLLVTRLVQAIAVLVADYVRGEVPALIHLCGAVLVALSAETDLGAETDEPEQRRCRYRREQAMLNLLVFCCVVTEFHSGSAADRRKSANVEALRTAVASALQELVSPVS